MTEEVVSKNFIEQEIDKDLSEINKIDTNSIIRNYGSFEGQYGISFDFGSHDSETSLLNLIVDDGSTDNSKEIIDRYANYDNIKIIYKENCPEMIVEEKKVL